MTAPETHRMPLRAAVRRYVIAEVEALAQLARDLGMDVRDDTPRRPAPTLHHLTTPCYVVTGPGGKSATLTLTGGENPAPAVVYRNPARASHAAPKTALMALAIPTVHVTDTPPLEAAP